jgi:type I restriction enzyme S subunit
VSRIDELIIERCPAGVDFCVLHEVAQTVPGLSGKTKADFSGGNARFVSYKSAFANLAVDQKALDFVALKAGEKQNRLHKGDVVITGSSESVSEVGMSSVVISEPAEPLYLNSFCFALRFEDPSKLLPSFSKYLFRGEAIRSQIRATASGVTRINISKPRFMKIRIPVPPIEVQREIVTILDQFTQLEAELEAELEARRAQRIGLANNFVVASRDQPHGPARPERVLLGSIARESVEPVKVQPDRSYVSLGVKWNGEGVLVRDSRGGESIKATTLYRAYPGQLIYNRMFVVEGSFALVPDQGDGAVVSGEFPLFELDTSRVEPQWLLQYLCDPYSLKQIESEVTGTERGSMKSRRRWKADQFRKFEISLPSLEVQQEIVGVLRASNELVHSLEDELAARRKQYEHYRDRLLAFKELVA